jgi:hypothetical protein
VPHEPPNELKSLCLVDRIKELRLTLVFLICGKTPSFINRSIWAWVCPRRLVRSINPLYSIIRNGHFVAQKSPSKWVSFVESLLAVISI